MTTIETRPAPTRSRTLAPTPIAPALPSVPTASPFDFDFDVAIVGLGYVGLPTALAYHASGARVLALDASEPRLTAIRSGRADLVPSDRVRLAEALGDEGFTLTVDAAGLHRSAAVIVCVPTPVDVHLVPDLTILRRACETVVAHAVPGQVILLTSTTYVGCTADLLVAPLAERRLDAGRNISVAFSAERINPGTELVAHDDVPRVVGGATPTCAERAAEVLARYAASVHVVHSLGAAEMTKLLENTFRAVNIALANEFADICRALDIAVTDVIDAAATKPYGFMPFLPGPGVGGHCIPCDPHYLLWQLRGMRIQAPMITQAMTEIAGRPRRVVDRAREVLSDAGAGLAGTRVLVVGVAYKPDVADLRESPALEIIEALQHAGAEVGYLDPLFDEVVLPDGHRMTGIVDPVAFAPSLVLLHTRHRALDLSWIGDHVPVLDGSYRETSLAHRIAL